MTMETRDKYTAPETEVLELQTEGVIADSECSNDGDPDWWHLVGSIIIGPEKENHPKTVIIAAEDGF